VTIRIRLSAGAVEAVTFSLSPFMETLWSLHVLHNPGRHVLAQNWMLTMRRRMGDQLEEELREFAFAFRGAPTSCGIPFLDREEGSFVEEIARFRQATPGEAARFFTRSFYQGREEIGASDRVPAPVAERLLAHARAIRASVELAQQALRSPREQLAAFAELVERYWYAGFNERWEARSVRLMRDVAATKERVSRGLEDFIRELPEVRRDPQGEGFIIERAHDHELTIGEGHRLVLTPSVFLLPHLRVSCERPGILAIAYPSRYESHLVMPLAPPPRLLDAFLAIGDDSRLRILRYLTEAPRTTQSLATLVNITPATVSSHLRKLESAGLVTSERNGQYVSYHATLDLAQLTRELSAYLNDHFDV
jgi:DNA-binding transcriptional ArsR family regulator